MSNSCWPWQHIWSKWGPLKKAKDFDCKVQYRVCRLCNCADRRLAI